MVSTSASSDLTRASLSSASSLMALQVFSRLFSFALNQILFRLSSPAAFGAASIQFELILSTILFLSREGVRNALLRVSIGKYEHNRLSFLPILLGIPLSLSTAALYTNYAGSDIRKQPHFEGAIALYALAAVVELACEPMYNAAMANLQIQARVSAEGFGITAKSLTTFAVLFYDSRWGHTNEFALVAFALGQVAYSLSMFARYLSYSGTRYLRPPPAEKTGLSRADLQTLRLSMTMTLQSLVKHFLTEGDKFILSWFSPLHDQGGYAIAVNYGSLIARILFQPIEETLRIFFSQALTTQNDSKHDLPSLQQAASVLITLLSVQTSFSLIFVVFGHAYLPIVLPLLLPQQYLKTSASIVLGAWVWYIPFLAVNGALEAFLSSVADMTELNRQSRWMLVFSTTFVASAIAFYKLGLGDASLVYANIVNLSARIIYCTSFVDRFFVRAAPSTSTSESSTTSTTPSTSATSPPKTTSPSPKSSSTRAPPQDIALHWQRILPSSRLTLAVVTSALLIHFSQIRTGAVKIAASQGRLALLSKNVFLHIGVGGMLAGLCMMIWWFEEGRSVVRSVRNNMGKGGQKEKAQ